MKSNERPVVTAVGRFRPKNNECQIHHVIRVKPDGTVKTVVKELIEANYQPKGINFFEA